MSHLDANTVTLDGAAVAPVWDRRHMAAKRPRVVLSITPRLLQDTLTVALSQHAEVVDLGQWREQSSAALEQSAFDVALVSGGVLPSAVVADVVINVDGNDGVPSLDSLHQRLRAISDPE